MTTTLDVLTADVRRILTGYARLVAHDGYLDPAALTKHLDWLIEDAAKWREAEAEGHVVTFTATGYGLQHPPSCRPDLIRCRFNRHLARLAAPAMRPGRYRMTWEGTDFPRYERLPKARPVEAKP